MTEQKPRMEWDVFVSHAAEDKEEVARPLAAALSERGLRVWYDEFTLTVGDRLHRSINYGLAHSLYGIVIVSPVFIAKHWTQKELEALAAREDDGRKVILPVWHHISVSDVRQQYPLLSDRLAVTTEGGLHHVVSELLRAMGYEDRLDGKLLRTLVQFEYTARISPQKLYAARETFEFSVALHVPDQIRRFVRHVRYFPPNATWPDAFGENPDVNDNFRIYFRGWGAPTVPAAVEFSDSSFGFYYIRHNWERNKAGGLKWRWGDKIIRAVGIWDMEKTLRFQSPASPRRKKRQGEK